MPPDREQRRLERQRGAAKRDIRNASGFDLIIPNQVAPLEPRQSGRSRKTPQPEPLVPQQSSRRTPATKTLPPPKSTRLPPASSAAPALPLSPNTGVASTLPRPRYSDRPSASIAIGKRKRPSGEAIFDIPGSPLSETAAQEPVRDLIDNNSIHGDPVGDLGEPDVESIAGPSKGLVSTEVQGDAMRKQGVKKRKKRKSIGQQATKRAKAKIPINQPRAVSDVKPESISPEPLPEGSSRLDAFPETAEDPAEAQIQNELAGAAARGRRDSLVGDAEDEIFPMTAEKKNSKLARDGHNKSIMLGKTRLPKKSTRRNDPHAYPSSTYLPTIETHDDPEDQHEPREDSGQTDYEDDDDDEPEAEDEVDETDEEYHIKRPSATPKKSPLSRPLKPKRKKRKSIGQQRPKRLSASHPPKSSIPTTTTKHRPKPPSKPHPSAATTTTRPARSNTVPITIYRPAPPSSPDTDTNLDRDPLTAPLPPPHTTALTAPDILSQLSRELVEKTAANSSLSARAQRTIAVYGQELEARMKQLGQALATNAGLGRRLRDVRKEERRVKGELEGVEVEVGGVRERIGEGREVEKGMKLAGLMEGLEKVVRRGWRWEKERERGKG